jgi:hypothetical protein
MEEFDANRATQNRYKPFHLETLKDGMIAGFLESVSFNGLW